MAENNPMHQQLIGHLLGALDDDEQEWVESMLECDEDYRREWIAWRRRLTPLLAGRPDCEPPVGLAAMTCRLVESCAPTPRRRELRARRMSPDGSVSCGVSRVGWLDVAAVALVLLVVGVLVPPAIQGSRFQSRLANCQDRLQQVGLALTQYGYRHGSPVFELADNEQLTGAGRTATGLLSHDLVSDTGPVLSSAWLSIQGVTRWSRQVGTLISDVDSLAVGVGPASSTQWFECAKVSSLDWPGTWRNGTIAGMTDMRSSTVALLADAPSADLPGQTLDSHDGLGRNVFYGDGHVDFLPCSVSRGTAQMLLSPGDSPTAPNISVPIRFVGSH